MTLASTRRNHVARSRARRAELRFDAGSFEHLLTLINEGDKPGVFYVARKKHARVLARFLRHAGVRALACHKRMPSHKWAQALASFRSAETEVLVATRAVRKKIKSFDPRFVVHIGLCGKPYL